MTLPSKPVRLSAWILIAVTIAEGSWVVINFLPHPARFLAYLGFASGRSGNFWAWPLAAAVAVLFVAASCRLPAVRENLFRPSALKVLAVLLAIVAGILEEVCFRKWVMDYAERQGADLIVQILASGMAFGFAHGVWGLLGRSARVALSATVATFVMGSALAVVYIASGRSLAPCIAAHVLITGLIEPGLVLAATMGQMERGR
jgi:hypothetical protein